MKILALQGSPRPKKYTQMVLDKFLEGAASKGAECETVHLAGQKIHPCTGCYTCWYKTPGICIHRDDMPGLLEKLRSCDVEVWATPLYIYGVTAHMKIFMERMLPLVEPYMMEADGVTRHPPRFPEERANKIVLISVCGFPEGDHFTALVENFRLLARAGGRELVGVLLRPGSESLLAPEWVGKKGDLVFRALYRAGQEIVEKGRVSAEVEEIVRQPWTQNRQGFQEQANRFWKVKIEHAERSRRGEETRPFEEAVREDIRILLGGMAVKMRRDLARDLRATIQFEVSGKQPGHWYLDIQDGTCSLKEGKADHPNLSIRTPSEVWVDVALGRMDGGKAFLEKKYTAEGDLDLLMQFKKFFRED